LAINHVIYAEVSAWFDRIEEVDAALPRDDFVRLDLPWAAAFIAGKCFVQYRKRGGERRSPLPDFFIGAHAAVQNLRLLTRDGARYRTYFPTVEVVAPG
jgi:predicted nucleic acid-binding protein